MLTVTNYEIDDLLSEYKEMTANGISTYSDAEVRNLFAKFSMSESYQAIVVGIIDKEMSAANMALSILKSKLLDAVYTSGPMTTRTAKVEANPDYIQLLQNKSEINFRLIIAKAELTALNTASAALSRDMSMRLKPGG